MKTVPVKYNSFWFAYNLDNEIVDFCCYSSILPNFDAIDALRDRHPRCTFKYALGCKLDMQQVRYLTTFPNRE